MSAVQFVESLPIATRGVGRSEKYAQIEAELKENPGVWGLVDTKEDHKKTTSIVQTLKRRGLKVATRKNEAGEVNVFAMFAGE